MSDVLPHRDRGAPPRPTDRGSSGHGGFASCEAWLAARRGVVGASEVAALFGCAPAYALSRYALWQVKAGRVPEPVVDGERPAWGLRLEAAIAGGAAEIHGLAIEPGAWVRHPRVEGMAATTDFHVLDDERGSVRPQGHPGPGVMEVKNADWLQHRRQWTDDEPPAHVLLQLQHQLACTGRRWGVVVALIGGNRLAPPYAYAARPALIAEIERRVVDFWASIGAGEPPEPDGTAADLAALRDQFPCAGRAPPLDLEGDPAVPGLCAAFLDAGARRRAAAAEEDAARARLLARLRDAGRARCAGYRIEAPAVAGVPDRAAIAGETVKGRCGYRRLQVREEP